MIADETKKEQEKGWLSQTYSREELDKRFGKGNWRFIPRFVLHQRLKDRLIDDAKRGGQNARAIFSETIYIANVDFIGEVLAAFVAELAWSMSGLRHKASTEEVLAALPAWFVPAIGVDDLPDAYRGVPLHPEDSRIAVVAFWDPKRNAWAFAVSRAMLFGLSAAVIHFNRKPTLAVAAARRWFGVAAAAFYDDVVRIASYSSEDTDGLAIEQILDAMGSKPAPAKTVPLGQARVWIGVLTRLGNCTEAGYYEQAPTENAVSSLVDGCRAAAEARFLSKTEASSLRGRANWANSHSAGRCGRVGLEVLQRKQREDDPKLTEQDILDLAFLALISSHLPEKRIWIAGSRGSPVRMYSDASFEPDDSLPGLGWVLFVAGSTPLGRAAHMPRDVLAALDIRKTQIFAAEVFAILAAVHEHRADLAGRDAIFFIDNEAACAAMVRGGSSTHDVGAIVNAIHWLLFQVDCRPWFEWVDSKSNCSDGLSRDGLADAWTCAQGWQLQEGELPPWNAVTECRKLALMTLGLAV